MTRRIVAICLLSLAFAVVLNLGHWEPAGCTTDTDCEEKWSIPVTEAMRQAEPL